jgi:hypothetical protein
MGDAQPKTLTRAEWISGLVPLALPALLFVVIDLRRPDLLSEALGRPSAQIVYGFAAAVAFGGCLIGLGGMWLQKAAFPRAGWLRGILFVAPHLACTLPAVFLVLFGPILLAPIN